MKSIKGSETEKNLLAALSGESIARNKYTYYAMAAREEGLEDIAKTFERLAINEMHHAKVWYETLHGTPKNTKENLKEAAFGEYSEWHSMYPGFAQKAREEGFDNLAVKFEEVAAIEFDHEKQFMQLFNQLMTAKTSGTQETKETPLQTHRGYRCQFCGAIFDTRPDVCKVCHAIGAFDSCTYEK